MGNDQLPAGSIVRIREGSKHAGETGQVLKVTWRGRYIVDLFNNDIRNTEIYDRDELEKINADEQ